MSTVDLTLLPGKRTAAAMPELYETQEHPLCPGCGHPVAWRVLTETLTELALQANSIGVVGHGCYTNIIPLVDLEFLQCLHGRAPAVATGVKRMLPGTLVYTLQGDGDLTSEGLQEAIHSAARAEPITVIMVNNGVFGDTGGHMTAATPIGQRTKTSLDGRDASVHGSPIDIGVILSGLPGAAYVARTAVNNAPSIRRTKKFLRRAFSLQLQGAGFTFVEILTMCPTGWFLPPREGGEYLRTAMESTYPLGELKVP